MRREDVKYEELTQQIIKAFYTVYNTLGYGFLEKVYERAMAIELRKMDLQVKCQYPVKVYYDGQVVGDFSADMLVEDCIIVELKAPRSLVTEDEAQLLNYLNATEYEVGLLLNFGPKPEIKRKVFDNERKKYSSQKRLTDEHG
jgi:GxxExxY protein